MKHHANALETRKKNFRLIKKYKYKSRTNASCQYKDEKHGVKMAMLYKKYLNTSKTK